MPKIWARALVAQALVLAVALGATGPVVAAEPAKPATPAVTRAEAQTALSVLRDDKRRAELITTLDAIAKAAPAAPAPSPAAATTAPDAAADAKPAAQAAIAPDSVGVQVVNRLSLLISAYAAQLAYAVRSVNDLPQLGQWLSQQASDPAARAEIADALLRLLAVAVAGALVEFAFRRLLRPVQASLHAWAPHRTVHDGTEPEHKAEAHRRRYERALGALRQLPTLLARLLLDLLPVAAFGVAVFLLLGTGLVQREITRLVISEALEAYVAARVFLAVAAFLYSPVQPRLRLLGVPDGAAHLLTRWTTRLIAIGVTGWAVSGIAGLFGLPLYAEVALQKLFALALHVCLIIAVLQVRVPVAQWLRSRRRSKRWSSVLSRLADVWHWIAIFYILALWLVWAVELRNGYQRLLTFCAVTALIAIGGRLLGVLVLGGMDRLRLSLATDRAAVAERAGIYYPALRGIVSAVIFFGTGIALLEAWNFPLLFWLTAGGLGGKVFEAARTIVLAIVLAIVAWETINAVVLRHLAGLAETAQIARAGRLKTLLPLMRTTMLIVLLLIVGMTILSSIGVNIAPLLAGAGVVGIAVGFGSQKLVQDLITGLFLLLENAMQVGDVVTVAGLTGTAEALTIRTIRLRALDGAVHVIPFSAVTTVTNQTRDFSYAVIDVSVGLNEEPAPIEEVLRTIAGELRDDPAWQSLILADLDVLGVEKLTDLAWVLRVRIKTQPASRWAVARELNRRIKVRFDELAIESPFTSHKVLSREPPPPVAQRQEDQAA